LIKTGLPQQHRDAGNRGPHLLLPKKKRKKKEQNKTKKNYGTQTTNTFTPVVSQIAHYKKIHISTYSTVLVQKFKRNQNSLYF